MERRHRTEQQHAPLLLPKLHMPRQHNALVARAQLLEQIEAGAASRLTVVVAPAGSGKTTLVRQWIAECLPATPIAWLSLDAGDNDPMRFWHYMLMACQQLGANVEGLATDRFSNALTSPFELPSLVDTVLTPLLNALTHLEEHATLILDDYHLIESLRVHESLAFLLQHLPLTLHNSVDTSLAQLGLARLFYEWNDLDRVREAAQEVSDLQVDLHNQSIALRAELLQLQIQQARGEADAARQGMAALLISLSPQRDLRLYHELQMAQVRLLLSQGDLAGARRALNMLTGETRADLPPLTNLETALLIPASDQRALFYREQETLLLARLLLAQARIPEATELLTGLLSVAQAAGHK